jgi:hypothetical protein
VPDAPKNRIRQIETLGLILLAFLALLFIILRHWGHIPWTAR